MTTERLISVTVKATAKALGELRCVTVELDSGTDSQEDQHRRVLDLTGGFLRTRLKLTDCPRSTVEWLRSELLHFGDAELWDDPELNWRCASFQRMAAELLDALDADSLDAEGEAQVEADLAVEAAAAREPYSTPESEADCAEYDSQRVTIEPTAVVPILAPDGSGPSAELTEIADAQSVELAVRAIQTDRDSATAEDIGAALFASHLRGDSQTRQSARRRSDLTVEQVSLGMAVFGQNEGGQS